MADGRHAVSLIAPLAAAGRAEEVGLRVGRAIQLGLLTDGERLPPEAEFAAQLGVSAMTLREALAMLRQHGLVETRRGRTGGTFVRRPAAPQPGPLRDRLRAMTAAELRDLTDEQSAVSGAAARLAATRAPTVSVRRLFALADQLAAAATPGTRLMADSRFHIEVALASKSQRLTALEVALQATLAELLWLPFAATGTIGAAGDIGADRADDRPAELLNPRAVAGEHAAIADAIEAEDGSRARLLAEEHAEANLRRLTVLRLTLPPQPQQAGGGAGDGSRRLAQDDRPGASRLLLLSDGKSCRPRHRQDRRSVGYAIDIANWCLWRRRQVGVGVDGVADMAQVGSSLAGQPGGGGGLGRRRVVILIFSRSASAT